MAAAGNATNNVLFCWEQVLRTNRLFRVSHAFAPPRQARRLLPLYALFGAIEELCSECSDDAVAWRKLEWWSHECRPANRQRSQHPVMRGLVETGAENGLSAEWLERLFGHAAFRLDAPAPPDMAGLRQLCDAIGRPTFELELAVCGGPGPLSETELGAAATSGLLQLLRESARRGSRKPHWWVPLNLLARHGIERDELASGLGKGSAEALFRDLLEQCSDWACPAGGESRALTESAAADTRRHLYVISQLQSRRLAHRSRGRLRSMLTAPDRPRLSDVYFAWRAARTLSRP